MDQQLSTGRTHEGDPGNGDGAEATGRVTYREFVGGGQGRSLRRLPRLLWSSIRLTYEAAPRLFALTTALDVFSGIGVAAQLLIGRQALEIVLAGKSTAHFGDAIPYLLALFVITVLLALAASIEAEQGKVLGELVTRLAYDRVFGVAERVELGAFESPQFFDRLQRAIINGSTRPIQMTTGLTRVITSGFTVLAISAVLLRLVPALLPIALIAYLPLWLAMAKNTRGLYDFMFRMMGIQRQRFYLVQVRSGRNEAKEVRAFGLSPLIKARYDRLYDQYIVGMRTLARRRIIRSLTGSVASSAMTVVVFGVLGYLYLGHHVGLATAATAIAALLQLSSQLQSFLGGTAILYEGSLFLGNYESFVSMEKALNEVAESHRLRRRAGRFTKLAAESVRFTYPETNRVVLDDVSVELNAGEIVALVGENGSGKTTLAKILAGLYRPDSGRVTWDDRDIETIDSEEVRESIAIIFQDFIRYLMSANDNIAAGKWQAMEDSERVRAAAFAANADPFLRRLPEGYDTLLGKEFEGGYDLSIGQWQRVALARAFFRQAPCVILDEPTSALDPRAEKELFDRIRALFVARSVLLISHRFSTVRSADRIYVLEQGRVVESGTHTELMAREGLYAELFTLQAAPYLGDETAAGAATPAPRSFS